MSPSSDRRPRVLVVDNHDSFVHTLVGYLTELGADVSFVEADEVRDAAALIRVVDAVMISPGPGTPEGAGASIAVVRAAAAAHMPLLGVCLGHQAIGVAFGATVAVAPEPMHGRASAVRHDDSGVFADLPQPVIVGRYHSLAIDERTLPAEIRVTARSADGVVMGLAHETLPIQGVQFHPESVLTEHGYLLLASWLASAGFPTVREIAPALQARGV